MKPAEINRRLALAIGYSPDDLFVSSGVPVYVWREPPVSGLKTWLVFDYMDWNTIGPIAAKYAMFPKRITPRVWLIYRTWMNGDVAHSCPQACIALAVIEAHERGLL
jgi:hypothetical protein